MAWFRSRKDISTISSIILIWIIFTPKWCTHWQSLFFRVRKLVNIRQCLGVVLVLLSPPSSASCIKPRRAVKLVGSVDVLLMVFDCFSFFSVCTYYFFLYIVEVLCVCRIPFFKFGNRIQCVFHKSKIETFHRWKET